MGGKSQRWEDMFALLQEYKRREGHCNVPDKRKEGGENLGRWLGTQRQLKKNEKLDPERLRRLEDLGIVWSFKKSH